MPDFSSTSQGGPSTSSQITDACATKFGEILVDSIRLTFGRGRKAKVDVEGRVEEDPDEPINEDSKYVM